MAGIGQHNSFDQPSTWSSAAQLGMGRTLAQDTSKTYNSIPDNDKMSLLGVPTALPVLSNATSNFGYNYASRNSSKTKVLHSPGSNLRTQFSVDTSLENGPASTCAHSYFSNPQRGISEPSLLSNMSSFVHYINPDFSKYNSNIGCNLRSQPSTQSLTSNCCQKSGGLSSGKFYPGSGHVSVENLLSTTGSSGLTFDPSDFPPISTAIGRSKQQLYHGQKNYVYPISKGSFTSSSANYGQNIPSVNSSQPPYPEFSIDQDFPALPTALPTTISWTSASGQTLSSSMLCPSQMQQPVGPSKASFDLKSPRLHRSHSGDPGQTRSTNEPLGLLPHHFISNIPKDMICDQFGMVGLLKLIQIGYYDARFHLLAPGLSLAPLSGNWQTPGELYTNFVTPYQDLSILRTQDIDYAVPSEYLIRHLIVDRLPDPPLDQLSEEALFWIFYNCCREELQLVASKELYLREWRFHIKEQIWLTRVVGADFSTDQASEQGVYYYWDPLGAEKETRQMTICYADLDSAPEAYRLNTSTLNASIIPKAGGAFCQAAEGCLSTFAQNILAGGAFSSAEVRMATVLPRFSSSPPPSSQADTPTNVSAFPTTV